MLQPILTNSCEGLCKLITIASCELNIRDKPGSKHCTSMPSELAWRKAVEHERVPHWPNYSARVFFLLNVIDGVNNLRHKNLQLVPPTITCIHPSIFSYMTVNCVGKQISSCCLICMQAVSMHAQWTNKLARTSAETSNCVVTHRAGTKVLGSFPYHVLSPWLSTQFCRQNDGR